MKYYRQGHCLYYTRYHLVISTKYRRKIFNEGVKKYFQKLIKQIYDYYPEIVFFEVNTDQDHAHLHVSIPPKMPVSRVVNIIKSNTSRALKKKFEFLKEVYWGTDGIWSDGYFVSTIGVNEKIIRKYIENQGREDRAQAKLDLG